MLVGEDSSVKYAATRMPLLLSCSSSVMFDPDLSERTKLNRQLEFSPGCRSVLLRPAEVEFHLPLVRRLEFPQLEFNGNEAPNSFRW